MEYTELNAKTIDKWIESGWEWGVPISHEEYINVQNGKWSLFLTPAKLVPKEWFLPYLNNNTLDNVKILGLASGGGQQIPMLAAIGADCTVLDYSDKQLESERLVSKREGYTVNIVKADMTKRLPFEDNSFDIIFHPVANCYVENVYHVWNECFRLLKKGGLLIAGMDNGMNFLFDDIYDDNTQLVAVNKVPFNPLKDPELYKKLISRDEGVQFSHTMEEQIGGQLKAGLVLTDIYEDRDREGLVKDYFPQYIATRAIKL